MFVSLPPGRGAWRRVECGEGWPETWELSVSEGPRAGLSSQGEKESARSQATPTPVPAPVLPTPDGPSERPSSPALHSAVWALTPILDTSVPPDCGLCECRARTCL